MTNSKTPFPFKKEIEKFDLAFTSMLRRELRDVQTTFLSPDNMLGYSHGRGWQSAHPNAHKNEGEFQEHAVETSIPFSKIVENDLSQIDKFKNGVIRGFNDQFMRTMYAAVSEAADAVGNTVSTQDHEDFSQTFLEALKKIEFGVDRNGKVSFPQFHVSPAMAEKITKELAAKGPEFEKQVNELIEVKSAAAKAREAERLSKFPQNGEAM